MTFRLIASVSVTVASLAAGASAFAASKKTGSTPVGLSGSATKTGTLVAMSGSGSLGRSSSADAPYVAVGLLPFEYFGLKTTAGNTTTETPATRITTMPKTLEFFGTFGAWNVRPELSLEQNTPSSLSLTYDMGSNLEVGGYLGYSRTAVTAGKIEKVTSSTIIGPRAFMYTELAGLPVEAAATFVLTFDTEDSKDNEGKTTKALDQSGYAFDLNVRATRELAAGLEGFAGVGFGYSSETNKTDKNNEITTSGISFAVTPAGLRFKF